MVQLKVSDGIRTDARSVEGRRARRLHCGVTVASIMCVSLLRERAGPVGNTPAGGGEGDFFSASPVTVYLTVSDPLSSRNAFKFNDISMQKIIEWE